MKTPSRALAWMNAAQVRTFAMADTLTGADGGCGYEVSIASTKWTQPRGSLDSRKVTSLRQGFGLAGVWAEVCEAGGWLGRRMRSGKLPRSVRFAGRRCRGTRWPARSAAPIITAAGERTRRRT